MLCLLCCFCSGLGLEDSGRLCYVTTKRTLGCWLAYEMEHSKTSKTSCFSMIINSGFILSLCEGLIFFSCITTKGRSWLVLLIKWIKWECLRLDISVLHVYWYDWSSLSGCLVTLPLVALHIFSANFSNPAFTHACLSCPSLQYRTFTHVCLSCPSLQYAHSYMPDLSPSSHQTQESGSSPAPPPGPRSAATSTSYSTLHIIWSQLHFRWQHSWLYPDTLMPTSLK